MMMSTNMVLLFFCFGGVLSTLPEGWSACKQSSPDYEDCLKKQITNAIRFFKNGNKKMGIIPLEPLRFEKMDLIQRTGPISITLKTENVNITGFSTTQVISVKNDWKEMIIKFHVPEMLVESDYTVKGQILILPISGAGKLTLHLDPADFTCEITFKQVIKDGKVYYQVKNMPVTQTTKKLTVKFDNLFNGNKELGDAMNMYINENWQEILEELTPALSQTLELAYSEYINRILIQIPAEDIDVK